MQLSTGYVKHLNLQFTKCAKQFSMSTIVGKQVKDCSVDQWHRQLLGT